MASPAQLAPPSALAWAHPVVAEWFVTRFGTPTEPQIAGWPHIVAGESTLISAPTGSGKTLAAFLVCIDQLLRRAIAGNLTPQTHVVYISPLKALSNDVQKNLEEPLREIQQLAIARGYLSTTIRTAVRTGDTLPRERAAMLRQPPHILVTTPESLYILLTSGKSRENLRSVSTVIVDEIHAVADDKRGAHLALSLERLDALVCGQNHLAPGAMLTGRSTAPLRIGLSATQNPIELVADFLTGVHPERPPAKIVQVGARRQMDLAVEIPSDELGSVTGIAMWEELYDRLAALAKEHRSTLVFVNTRKMSEKVSFALGERLGAENVAAHHGSLSRALRLDAEQRLKAGEIKILVATASLELGIDIGAVDLVCQLGSTRSVSVAMQRIGRAGHWRGAVPKGRLFAATRDELVEQASLIRAMRAGELDRLEIPPQPLDVLMQQIVAACAAESWNEDALYDVLRRAYPYRNLTRAEFGELITLLHEGIESSRGRYGSYLLRDGVHGELHARRGARMIAVCNGGSIGDTALFNVILMPEGVQIATLGEHFAVESSPGDVILLGNNSWRVQRVEAAGQVLVEDAKGQPPSVPFWDGEAPARTPLVSAGVSELRERISAGTPNVQPGCIADDHPEVAATMAWLMDECSVCAAGARQMIAYIVAGRAVLGAVPTTSTLIAERFFDEGGGMQLILHAPFGGRINKAWGLALRKRFCRGFNFELQAAATDNGINIALAEQHSFPLADVFEFLTAQTVQSLLEQAALAAPVFKTRWRWAANRSLQLLRFSRGKKVAPQIQRSRSDDLLASVFPQAAACFENIEGDIVIPEHPLVREVMKDVLGEAMDLAGLVEVLNGIRDGSIQCLAVDTPVPSQFAHELLNANVNAFLDDAGLEERRARAVSMRRSVPDSVLGEAGRLAPEAIAQIRTEAEPDIRDEHEMHDLLHSLIALPADYCDRRNFRDWRIFLERLRLAGRAHLRSCGSTLAWVSTERLPYAAALWPQNGEAIDIDPALALQKCLQGWLQILGPVTSEGIAHELALSPAAVFQSMLALEMQGTVLRGQFESGAHANDESIEWCERRLLQRIHRLTLGGLRKQIEPVTPAIYMRWLMDWQHISPAPMRSGEDGVLEALAQLEGFEAPAVEWERSLLPARVAAYDSRWLDQLCLSGAVGWGRISPHPAWSVGVGNAPRRVVPTGMAPITFYLRESAEWLPYAIAQQAVDEQHLAIALSPDALRVRNHLELRGASFAEDMQRDLQLDRVQIQNALWELATAGLASADGFDQLRILMDPRRNANRKAAAASPDPRRRAVRTAAGRWSLLRSTHTTQLSVSETARQQDAALESAARMLLARYGVLFRDLLAREANAPRWRDLLGILRRMEARGELRGGRFVSGFGGEQYAMPEAVLSLRAARDRSDDKLFTVAAADPMNLVGVILPGERVSGIAGRTVQYRNGVPAGEEGRKPPQPAVPPVEITQPRAELFP